MGYNPGTLHVKRRRPDGTAPSGYVRVRPSADPIRDPDDGTVVISGTVAESLVDGEVSIELPPTVGMDPSPLTYDVQVWLGGLATEPWITGVEIVAGQVTELAQWTSVVPGPAVPNVEATLQALVTEGETHADTAAAAAVEAVAAAGSVAPGVPGGVATLDEGGRLPDGQVPERLTEPGLSASKVRLPPAWLRHHWLLPSDPHLLTKATQAPTASLRQ